MNGWQSSSAGMEALGTVEASCAGRARGSRLHARAGAGLGSPRRTPPPAPPERGTMAFGLTPEEAEDVLQDTFESVFTKRPRVHNMEGYLVASFFNRCCDRLEKRLRQGERESPLPAELPDARAAARLVDGLHVRSAFRLLTPRCRHLIQAYCVFRRSLAETAADAGCTVPAVWKRLNQCMKRMRGCLA